MPETPDLADYEWPTCIACRRDLWTDETDRYACRPCEDRTHQRLNELPNLVARISTTAALMRGSRKAGAPTSGSRVPPIPPRIDVLSLAASGGVAARLQIIEDSWRKALGWAIEPRTDGVRLFASWRTDPMQVGLRHITFLRNNLLWACGSYESVDQDIEEIRRLQAECTSALNPDRKPGRVKTGLCPVVLDEETAVRCASQLTASTGSFLIRCGNCQTRWDGKEEWEELRSAQRAVVDEESGMLDSLAA